MPIGAPATARAPSGIPRLPRTALVMGLGRHGGGMAAARFLAEQGVAVTVTDTAEADSLRESFAALADLPMQGYTLGRHDPARVLRAELVVANPAVRLDDPLLDVARRGGAG